MRETVLYDTGSLFDLPISTFQAALYWKLKMLTTNRSGNKWKFYRARSNWYFNQWNGRLDAIIGVN